MNNIRCWRSLPGLLLVPMLMGHPSAAKPPNDDVELESEEQNTGASLSLLKKSGRGGRAHVRLRIVDHTLVVLDQDGKKKKELKLEDDDLKNIKTHVHRSKNGRRIGIHTTRGIRKASESWEESDFIVIDEDGNETLRLRNPGGESIVPSPDGKYAVGLLSRMAPSGPPLFIDEKGLRNKWLKGFSGGTWPDRYYADAVSFSGDAKKVAIGARLSWRKRLTIIYDETGNESARIESSGNPIFSESGKYLALQCVDASSASVFCVAETNGAILWRDSESFKSSLLALYSADESRVLFADGFGTLKLFETATGKLLWAWKSALPTLDNGFEPLTVRGVDANDDLSVVALGAMILKAAGPANIEREEDRIIILREGALIGQVKTKPGGIEMRPTVDGVGEMSFSIDGPGKSLTVAAEGKLRTYRMRANK